MVHVAFLVECDRYITTHRRIPLGMLSTAAAIRWIAPACAANWVNGTTPVHTTAGQHVFESSITPQPAAWYRRKVKAGRRIPAYCRVRSTSPGPAALKIQRVAPRISGRRRYIYCLALNIPATGVCCILREYKHLNRMPNY
jgi:hypothetical protein